MDTSEYNVQPQCILMHHPHVGNAMLKVSGDELEAINFLSVPAVEKLYSEYDRLVALLKDNGIEVTFLEDHLRDNAEFQTECNNNPNLMFLRDSSVTLPWLPGFYIPARLALASRANEPKFAGMVLEKLGLKKLIEFTDDEYLEGGDVLPVMHHGKRILVIGFGARTTQASAIAIARKLIPEHIDEVIGLKHDPDLLHLDTGFTILPGKLMFAAGGMFHDGFVIDRNKQIHSIDPIEYAAQQGFIIIRTNKQEAIEHERCNMLPLGNKRYIAFNMPEQLQKTLEIAAGIKILIIEGEEIAKATGGVHCLTRPVYL